MIMPLEMLRSGEWADIEEVLGEPGWIGRLAELGIRSGNRLRVLTSGTPCLLQINGSRLSWRGEMGTQILVRPVAV